MFTWRDEVDLVQPSTNLAKLKPCVIATQHAGNFSLAACNACAKLSPKSSLLKMFWVTKPTNSAKLIWIFPHSSPICPI